MKYLAYGAVAIAALALGFVLGGLQRHDAHDDRPSHAPEFALLDLNGRTHRLADYQGKLLLVNFWATWCTPCLKEIPRLQAAHERYADQGLAVLGPAVDDTAAVSHFVASHTMSYPVVVGETDLFALMDAFGDTLGALPFTVLVGRDGQILERHWGELSQKLLDEYLNTHL